MRSQIENKYLGVNKWGSVFEDNVISIHYESIQPQELDKDDILIDMKYSCIHPVDLISVTGQPYSYWAQNNILPSKAGFEGVGEVLHVGSAVKNVKVGDIVIPDFDAKSATWSLKPAAWSEYVVVKSIKLQVDKSLPLEQACQLFLNPFTAMGLLDAFGFLKDKSPQVKGWVVQNVANSTVGRMVHNLLKIKGIKSIAMVRKEDAVEDMKKEGADKVIVTGGFKTPQDHTKAIMEATEGQGAEYGIEAIGGDVAGPGMFHAMNPKSNLQVYGVMSGKWLYPINFPNPKEVKVELFHVGYWSEKLEPDEFQGYATFFMNCFKEQKIGIPVQKVFPLDQYKEAFDFQVNFSKSRTGKVLLKHT